MMRDPFKIDGPTCISFSGGRTSAYMLWRVLQSNGGLPAEAIVCFANTGKEEEATLRFVRDCGERWGVPITWVEYRPDAPGFMVVDFATASRNGEPFEALIVKRNYLPNPVARFCTVELKILTIERHLKAKGWDDWDSLVGVRADEPRRVAKMRADPKGGRGSGSRALPLADAGIGAADVGDFWKSQAFDLGLPNRNGVTMHGNCDLCFLKGASQVQSLIAEKPERAIWWARMESSITNAKIQNGGRFRSDRPSYAAMLHNAQTQSDFIGYDEESIPCFCGD
jgi:3'-phosphoadenosine 5'-phosphosulfate sulfotransferase (PAPS reductase)/FAD synthetase